MVIAAYIVKSMPLEAVKWLVIAIVAYAAFTMLRSAYIERSKNVIPSVGA